MQHIRTHMLDASALAKLFLEEPTSDVVRTYFAEHSVFLVTSYVVGEVLGILKRVHVKGGLPTDQYLACSEELMAMLRNETLQVEECALSLREVFDETEKVARKYQLDIVDAHQLVALARSVVASLPGDSRAIFVTADQKLAEAATSEGLRVWDCRSSAAP